LTSKVCWKAGYTAELATQHAALLDAELVAVSFEPHAVAQDNTLYTFFRQAFLSIREEISKMGCVFAVRDYLAFSSCLFSLFHPFS